MPRTTNVLPNSLWCLNDDHKEYAFCSKCIEHQQEIVALKLRIKKLVEDVTYYEEKFKHWDHDTDVLIKALSEIRKTTDKIFTSAV